MKELTKSRTLCSKLFDITDEPGEGSRRLITTINPLHYVNDGVLEDIDMTVVNSGVHKCGYDINLFPDRIGYHGTAPDGKAVELELMETYVEPVIKDNQVLYPEVSKDVDFQIIFLPTMIRVNRILKAPGAKRMAQFRIKREEGIQGKLLNLGADSKGRKTELQNIEAATGNPHEKLITQTWSGKVAAMNPDTRKKEWSAKPADIKYPVTIDPTVTFDVTATAEDGFAYSLGTFSDISTGPLREYATVGATPSTNLGAVMRFSGITIPQSATINSATLQVYVNGTLSGAVTVMASDASDPNLPTKASLAFSEGNKANPISTGCTFSGGSGFYLSPANYDLVEQSVTDIVQALVNSYEYDNDAMVFVVKSDAAPTLRINLYPGTPEKVEALVIDYTPPYVPPQDKTSFQHG